VTVDKSPARIREMFDDITPTYDLLNHLLSLNVDRLWRRRAAELCASPSRALDVCAGTGDMAIEIRRRWPCTVVAADFAHEMLRVGMQKARRAAIPLRFLQADTTCLPFPDGHFDSVSVAFGIRNVHDTAAGVREMARVTRPGGRVVILEFTTPPNPLLRPAYLLYFTRILPLIGSFVSGTRSNAYAYLPESVSSWHPPRALGRIMEESGLGEVRWELLSFGIAAIHTGIRATH
jgi:demethylmenaquinone methyltransferase/2-methoxy-6-polyprenyl-1,4-benzoquinol methylase